MINWKNIRTIIDDIETINHYYLWNEEENNYIKKWYIKKLEDSLIIVKPLEIFKKLRNDNKDLKILNILTINKWEYTFSIIENFKYNYNLLYKYYDIQLSEEEIDFIKLLEDHYFLDLLKELKENEKYSNTDRCLFAMTYELYNYFENKLHWMVYDMYYFLHTLEEINDLIQSKDIEWLLKFDDMVIWIELEKQYRLQKKIQRLYQKYFITKKITWVKKKEIDLKK